MGNCAEETCPCPSDCELRGKVDMEYTPTTHTVKVVIDECPTPDTVMTHVYILTDDEIASAIIEAVTDFKTVYPDSFIKYICGEFIDSVRVL